MAIFSRCLILFSALVFVGCSGLPKTGKLPPPPSIDGKYGKVDFAVSPAEDLAKTFPTLEQVRTQGPGKTQIVKAKVVDVCQKKGCWMKVQGPREPIRVTFEGYSFFVPLELKGREVVMKGRYVLYRETVAEQKHLLEDAKRPQSEIDAIKEPREVIRFVASGIQDLSV